ncbi:MAG: 2-amino-4-hydroxy-6-hydroxymethyldihydropteridine diphosphokinase [Candidatus Sulfobium sp.]
MAKVHIGIGSNIGDRHGNCLKAVAILREDGQTILKRSSLYETEPWGVEDQPRFINMAIEIETDLDPQELLLLLKKTEKNMGRVYTSRWGPRSIDLDILLYEDMVVTEEDVQIPHPRMHERAFVLEPLAEISPGKIHPVLLKRIDELLHLLRS